MTRRFGSRGFVAALWLVVLSFGCRSTPHVDSRVPKAGSELQAHSSSAAALPARTLPALGPHEGVAVGIHGAVASAELGASRAGLDVLRRGGNAVDAAVAIAFALAVTHPTAGNLGGGGFMLVRTAKGESFAIDYRETAPLSASRDMYLNDKGELTRDSVLGPRAAGVPGTVAGLALAHAKLGTRPWAELLAPAIALARDGHEVDASHARQLLSAVQSMRAAGFVDTARLYSVEDGRAYPEGAVWTQPELAKTLEHIAKEGPASFYKGPWALGLVQAMQKIGGLWTAEDLADYRAIERQPIRFEYLGHEILTMPPPSAGGVVLRAILFASERFELRKSPWQSTTSTHVYLEAARRAYADRNAWLGDPDFVRVPVAELMSEHYLTERMQSIELARATPSSEIKPATPEQLKRAQARAESKETTHFSVVDEQGNAVANTYTLNASFGALVAIPGTGILLNNEMDDFASQPGTPNLYGLVQGEANKIEPKKRMLSSMTPTIITKDGKLRAVLGTPGGPTITTTVAQLTRALLDHGITLDEAVRAPRLHHQWLPDQVTVEARTPAALRTGLEALGHKVATSSWGTIGHADCIEVDPATQGFRAVADLTRSGGGALAY
jgi:gamma-glutamyltranspeptidase/glutathione hydrolase